MVSIFWYSAFPCLQTTELSSLQLEAHIKLLLIIYQMYLHYFSNLKYIIFPTWLYKGHVFFLQVSTYFYKYECCQYQFTLSLFVQLGANQVPRCTNHFGTVPWALVTMHWQYVHVKGGSNTWRNWGRKCLCPKFYAAYRPEIWEM